MNSATASTSVHRSGVERMLFGTDFPHIDHDLGILDRLFAPEAVLSPAVLRAAVWDNPVRLLGPLQPRSESGKYS